MTHTPFLQRVAERYALTPNLSSHCFVFPNKRSATFFSKYLREAVPNSRKPIFEPEYIDITEFVSRFTPLSEASRYESLFTLFNCYAAINPSDSEITFDRFLYWGEMLVNDFNDVDRYLVDPDALFANLERLREIGSNYLTPEQQEIIHRFWGEEYTATPATDFWRHLHRNNSKTTTRFKQLWEVLAPLYKAYMEQLEQRGLTTRGRMYRIAAQSAGLPEASWHTASRFVFIGFNVLTTAEIKIFRRLKALGQADFFWDFNSPALANPHNKAGRFLRRNLHEFPMPADFAEEPITTFPQITVEAVPSAIGQTRVAASKIEQWLEQGVVSKNSRHIDTAIVLPDESLFISMMHAMPTEIEKVNVTMGLPMRFSPVALLTNALRTLQKNAHRRCGEVVSYFFEDVRRITTMPLVQQISSAEATALNNLITTRRLYNVTPADIATIAPTLAPLMQPLSRHTPFTQVAHYLLGIIAYIQQHVPENDTLQLRFLEAYADALHTLTNAGTLYGIEMDAITFLTLIQRAVRGDSVPFEGEPLQGLQVMGMLETRALDFNNIIITSMNERVFPRRHFSRSFIPDVLRRGFGMATTDFQESIFAYYFYRLIARAERVCLLYDSRTLDGVGSSEMSRYISQLLYLFPQSGITLTSLNFAPTTTVEEPLVVTKTPDVMEKLMLFTKPKSGRALSASAIKTYLNCPLQFYLQYVEKFNPDRTITDFITPDVLGNIIHSTLEHIFLPFTTPQSDGIVTAEFLTNEINPDNPHIAQLTHRFINELYYHETDPARFRKLVGEGRVLSIYVAENVRLILKRDIELAPFRFIAAEKRLEGVMKINNQLSVNYKQFIDRIDEITSPHTPSGKLLRIVDYKSGSDKLEVSDLAKTFTDHSYHAILQLLFYCKAYCIEEHHTEAIQPVIYKTAEAALPLKPVKIGKQEVTDHRPYMQQFNELFNTTIEEIFNPGIPFTCAPDEKSCTFCNFKPLCGRQQ